MNGPMCMSESCAIRKPSNAFGQRVRRMRLSVVSRLSQTKNKTDAPATNGVAHATVAVCSRKVRREGEDNEEEFATGRALSFRYAHTTPRLSRSKKEKGTRIAKATSEARIHQRKGAWSRAALKVSSVGVDERSPQPKL